MAVTRARAARSVLHEAKVPPASSPKRNGRHPERETEPPDNLVELEPPVEAGNAVETAEAVETTDAAEPAKRVKSVRAEPPGRPGEPAEPAPDSSRPTLGPSPGSISPSDLLAAAGRKAMWVHLDRLLTREPGARDPGRPDELRKYRVATRRLRAALRMFAPAYPDREVRPLRRGLADLADTIGGLRDLDNRVANLNQWAIERDPGSRAAVSPLLLAWSAERERAAAALHDRLETRRHRRLLNALVAFVEPGPGRRRKRSEDPHTIGDRIASMLWAAYEDVRAYAPIVRWADVETLHDLRISTKRLRDDIDFLAQILGPQREPLSERLVALQDHLGALNDAAVAATAVRTFLEDRHATLAPEEQAEIAAYLSHREREVARLRRTSVQRWRPVAGIAFARRLARLVVVPAGMP